MDTTVFGIRLNEDDRVVLREVASRLRRSQGDALRVLLHKAAEDLRKTDKVIPVDYSNWINPEAAV